MTGGFSAFGSMCAIRSEESSPSGIVFSLKAQKRAVQIAQTAFHAAYEHYIYKQNVIRQCLSNYSFIKSFLQLLSIPIAPNGAVINMASTATDSTIFPQGRPSDSGTGPKAACTVAFGR